MARASRAATVLWLLWRAALRWVRGNCVGFQRFLWPQADAICTVPFVLGVGLAQGRLTGTGQRHQAPVAGSSFTHLPEAGWSFCSCVLPSELRGAEGGLGKQH